MTDSPIEEGGKTYTIEQRDEISVYAGQKGHVVIIQRDYTREENTIILHPADVDLLIQHLQQARAEALEIRASE